MWELKAGAGEKFCNTYLLFLSLYLLTYWNLSTPPTHLRGCWELCVNVNCLPASMHSALNYCFPQQFGLFTESWAVRNCKGIGESCLIIPHSKWVSQQQTMTALNRSSFQFALSSLWFIRIKKVFWDIEQSAAWKWLKGRFGKGWWSKDREATTKYIFNSFKLVEEKFELRFALNLN